MPSFANLKSLAQFFLGEEEYAQKGVEQVANAIQLEFDWKNVLDTFLDFLKYRIGKFWSFDSQQNTISVA